MATLAAQSQFGGVDSNPRGGSEGGASGATPGARGGVSEAAPAEVARWLRAGEAALIDVREADEHARERIEGAALVALSRFDAASALGLAKPGQRVVFHCKSGRRSADAARLASDGAPGGAVYTMTGGIEAWKSAGLPVRVNTATARMSVMRQVQLVIGVGVLTGAALAWLVHPGFLAIPAFFGAGLVFAGATGTCGLAALLGMAPWNKAK